MDINFLGKTILSFLVGGLWISLTTFAAERFGTRLGGYLSGLPSTIVVSLLFIGWMEGAETAYDATTIIPLAFALNVVFLTVFISLSAWNFSMALIGSLLAWALPQGLVIALGYRDFTQGLILCGLSLVGSQIFIKQYLGIHQLHGQSIPFNLWLMIARAFLGGGIVSIAVFLSRVSGPIMGGIFAVFPAVALSTIIIAYRSHGVNFAQSIIPSFMISMVVNCLVYTFLFRMLVPHIPIIPTAAGAYAGSMLSGYIVYRQVPGFLATRK
jgi:hypothetical protein